MGTGSFEPGEGRWVTRTGHLTAAELEAACAARGVRMDRARRTYWQSERVFPQPERRLLHPPEGRGGARGYYHRGAVDLAWLIDYAMRLDHPAKAERWRCTAPELAAVLAAWRREGVRGDAGAAEEAFYAHLAGAVGIAAGGRPIPGVEPRHRDVLPPGQRRVEARRREEALRATAEVTQAIADGWSAEHAGEPPPEKLVVWFRLERAGPGSWRIADAGARRTSHDAQRLRAAGEAAPEGSPQPPGRSLV